MKGSWSEVSIPVIAKHLDYEDCIKPEVIHDLLDPARLKALENYELSFAQIEAAAGLRPVARPPEIPHPIKVGAPCTLVVQTVAEAQGRLLIFKHELYVLSSSVGGVVTSLEFKDGFNKPARSLPAWLQRVLANTIPHRPSPRPA